MPTNATQTFSPRPPLQLTAQANLAVPPLFPPPTTSSQPSAQQQRDFQPSPIPLISNNHGLAALAAQSTPASEFDPVLLTKSDVLADAEINAKIKRQRTQFEKDLREQFEKKRLEARKKPSPSEAKPDFDIPAILAQVLEALKPPQPKDDPSATDSFDENSFYSSRAPDSTPERGPPSLSPQQDDEDGEVADAPSGARVQSAVMGAPLDADADDDSYVPRERDAMDIDD